MMEFIQFVVPSGISLIINDQVIAKRPLKIFQSAQLIPRKVTNEGGSVTPLVYQNRKLQMFLLEDQLGPPLKNLFASQSMEVIMFYS